MSHQVSGLIRGSLESAKSVPCSSTEPQDQGDVELDVWRGSKQLLDGHPGVATVLESNADIDCSQLAEYYARIDLTETVVYILLNVIAHGLCHLANVMANGTSTSCQAPDSSNRQRVEPGVGLKRKPSG